MFLLPSTLQVDLAFVAEREFRPLSTTFRLVSGKANAASTAPGPNRAEIIGFGWLHAVHARTCIARQKLWQAEYMIAGIRNNALALTCLRHGLPAVHGRGIDELPASVTAPFEDCLVRQVGKHELSRAFRASVAALLHEIQCIDGELARKLERIFADLTSAAGDG